MQVVDSRSKEEILRKGELPVRSLECSPRFACHYK